MSKEVKNTQDYKIEYPSHEEARFFSNSENYPISDIIIGMTYPFASYKVSRERTNKYFLFEYVLSGEGKAKINGKWQSLNKGDLLFYDRNDDQYFYSNKSQPLHKIWFSFSSEYVEKMIDAYKLKSGVYKTNSCAIFEDIFNISKNDSLYNQSFYIIADGIHKIIIDICSLENEQNPSQITKIKNELSKSIYQKVPLKTVAENLMMSESTLIRTFKKLCGVTPYQYVLSEKIKVSKSLLRTTNMSIKEIAYLLCFTDEHYFSFYFKEFNKMTPTEYKKNR